MKIALASPPIPKNLSEGLFHLEAMVKEASAKSAEIICFIYFASINYSSSYSESASAIIDPLGNCVVHEAYGRTGIIIADIDPDIATGILAKRFKNALYK